MTDNEIIKALECCEKPVGEGCKECPLYNTDCSAIDLDAIAIDLINRQKAEVERLNKEVDRLSQCVLYHDGVVSDLEKDILISKTEAHKKFVLKIKMLL